MKKKLAPVFLIVTAMGMPVRAQMDMPEDVETVQPLKQRPGLNAETETELWLQVQSSGQLAGSRYTIPGKIATLSYQRYLNSFKYPIPRQFAGSGTGTSSGSSGSSGGASAGSGASPSR